MADTQETANEPPTDQQAASNGNEDDEITLDPHEVSDVERIENAEFFNSKRAGKDPDRYLLIRNKIIAQWNLSRPQYLTKRKVRETLTNCGDVNAIGRVHSFLERVGAINRGCNKHKPKIKTKTTTRTAVPSSNEFPPLSYSASRKRKVRDENGEWVAPEDLEGRTVDHEDLATINEILQAEEEKRNQNRIKRQRGSDFDLLELKQYKDSKAPFKTIINKDVLLVADFHAQLATTEIIGLLGGTYDPTIATLTISLAYPCKAFSSRGYECEMDPASEIAARELFETKSLSVVGWYHSHPSFPPIPSIRDVINQTNYQTLLKLDDGTEPFIGVIVAPFQQELSEIKVFHVSDEVNETRHIRLPYECISDIKDIPLSQETVNDLYSLISEYATFKNRVDLQATTSHGSSYLTSLSQSLHTYLDNMDKHDSIITPLLESFSQWES